VGRLGDHHAIVLPALAIDTMVAMAPTTDRYSGTDSGHMMTDTDEIGLLATIQTVNIETISIVLVVVGIAQLLDRPFVTRVPHMTTEEIRHTIQVHVTSGDPTTMTSPDDMVMIVTNVLDAVFHTRGTEYVKIRHGGLHDPEAPHANHTDRWITMMPIDIVHLRGLDHHMVLLARRVIIASTLSTTLRTGSAHRLDLIHCPTKVQRFCHDVMTIPHRLTQPAGSRGQQRLIRTDDHRRHRTHHHRDHPAQTVHGPRSR